MHVTPLQESILNDYHFCEFYHKEQTSFLHSTDLLSFLLLGTQLTNGQQVLSLHGCADLCQKEPTCDAFVYINRTMTTQIATSVPCYLKSNLCSVTSPIDAVYTYFKIPGTCIHLLQVN